MAAAAALFLNWPDRVFIYTQTGEVYRYSRASLIESLRPYKGKENGGKRNETNNNHHHNNNKRARNRWERGRRELVDGEGRNVSLQSNNEEKTRSGNPSRLADPLSPFFFQTQ